MAVQYRIMKIRRKTAALMGTLLEGQLGLETDTRRVLTGSSMGNQVIKGDYVTPEMYGAKGDGGDDAAAINACVNALPTSGGTIFCSAKSYGFGSPLNVITKRGIRFIGAGRGQGDFAAGRGTEFKAIGAMARLLYVLNSSTLDFDNILFNGNFLATDVVHLDTNGVLSTWQIQFKNDAFYYPGTGGKHVRIETTPANGDVNGITFINPLFSGGDPTNVTLYAMSSNARVSCYNPQFYGGSQYHVYATGVVTIYNFTSDGATGGVFYVNDGWGLQVHGGRAEDSANLLVTSAVAGNNEPVVLSGVSHAGAATNSIVRSNAQKITLIGCTTFDITNNDSSPGLALINHRFRAGAGIVGTEPEWVTMLGSVVSKPISTFAYHDTTPSVAGTDIWQAAGYDTTITITTFHDGTRGQTITILFLDALINIAETDNIVLSRDFVSSVGDVMQLIFDGTTWYEISRASITDITGSPTFANLLLNGIAGGSSNLNYRVGNNNRWVLQRAGAEPGADAGGDLTLYRYHDDGSYLGTALTVIRATGKFGINDPAPAEYLDVDGNINVTGQYKVADVQVVGAQALTQAALKADYTTGDLNTEAEIIAAINATNAGFNTLLAKIKTHGLLASA